MTKKKMNKKSVDNKSIINKIIYFDKETICNILQEFNKGNKQTITKSNDKISTELDTSIASDAKIKMQIPFFARLGFLFSSKITTNWFGQLNKTITVTSTEISDFEKVKSHFVEFSSIKISDIENSATFFRVAGNYARIIQGGIKDVNIKEFKGVMEGYEGYDHYKIDEETYIRFNSNAFLSNYKRNDLLNSRLRIYCIYIGKFSRSDFDFIEQLNKMQKLSTSSAQTLSDVYPCVVNSDDKEPNSFYNIIKKNNDETVFLYDVVYASIEPEKKDEKI